MSVPASSMAFQVVNPPNTKPKEPKKVEFNKPTVKGVIRNDKGGVHRYVLDNDKVNRTDWGKFDPFVYKMKDKLVGSNINTPLLPTSVSADNGVPIRVHNDDFTGLETKSKDGVDSIIIGRTTVPKSKLPKDYSNRVESIRARYKDPSYVYTLSTNKEVPLYHYIQKKRQDIWRNYNKAVEEKDAYAAAEHRFDLDEFDRHLYYTHFPRVFASATKTGFGTTANNNFFLETGTPLSEYMSTNPDHITEAMKNKATSLQDIRNMSLLATGGGLTLGTFNPFTLIPARAASIANTGYNWYSLGKSIAYKQRAAYLSAQGKDEEAAIAMRKALEADNAEAATGTIATGDALSSLATKWIGAKAVTPLVKRFASKMNPVAGKIISGTTKAVTAAPTTLANIGSQATSIATPFVVNNPSITAGFAAAGEAIAENKDNPVVSKTLNVLKNIPGVGDTVEKVLDTTKEIRPIIKADQLNQQVDATSYIKGSSPQKIDMSMYNDYLQNLESIRANPDGHTFEDEINLATNSFFNKGRVPRAFYESDVWTKATTEQRMAMGQRLLTVQFGASTKPSKGVFNPLGAFFGAGKQFVDLMADPEKVIATKWEENPHLKKQATLLIKNLPDSDFFNANGNHPGAKIVTALLGRVMNDDPVWGTKLIVKGVKHAYNKGKLTGGIDGVSPQLKTHIQNTIKRVDTIYKEKGKEGFATFLDEELNDKEATDILLTALTMNNGNNKNTELFDKETTKLVTEASETMIHNKFKRDPFGMMPNMCALFMAKHGYGDVAKFLSDPTNFYITAGLLIVGIGAIGGSMLGLFGGGSSGTEDSSLEDDAVMYKRRLRRQRSNAIYNNMFENYRGNNSYV